MERVEIVTKSWRSKSGDIPLTDRDRMTDDYLQNILNTAEYGYMQHNNVALKIAEQIGRFEDDPQKELKRLNKKAKRAYRTSVIYRDLVYAIRTEAERRGVEIKSLTEKDPSKFQILVKEFNQTR